MCDKYLNVLLKELEDCNIDNKLKTIYIGGGSPSCLNDIQLDKLLGHLYKYLYKDSEFSIEVNPENITEEKIKILVKYGVNRVSIGIQSFDESMLSLLGRKHNFNDVKKCVDLLNKYGIYNYSFDFIYGVKGQSIQMINNDLENYNMVEKCIVFANPLRSQFVEVDKLLKEIEELFVEGDYIQAQEKLNYILNNYHPAAFDSFNG